MTQTERRNEIAGLLARLAIIHRRLDQIEVRRAVEGLSPAALLSPAFWAGVGVAFIYNCMTAFVPDFPASRFLATAPPRPT